MFHLPYLILCQLTLHKHDINAPSAIVHCSPKWKCWNGSVPPNTFLEAHLQLSFLSIRERFAVSQKLPLVSHIYFQPFHWLNFPARYSGARQFATIRKRINMSPRVPTGAGIWHPKSHPGSSEATWAKAKMWQISFPQKQMFQLHP